MFSFRCSLLVLLLPSILALSSPSPPPRASLSTCPHFITCSGCTISDPSSSKILSTSSSFFSRTFPSIMYTSHQPTPSTSWRNQAKLATSPVSKFKPGVKLGLYASRSHDLIPIPDCAVHDPLINTAVSVIERATAKAGVTSYTNNIGKGIQSTGMLRYVQINTFPGEKLR